MASFSRGTRAAADQAAYYGIFSSNRIEIADAFYAPLLDYAASGQAEQEASHHGCPGTYHFPSHIGAYGCTWNTSSPPPPD